MTTGRVPRRDLTRFEANVPTAKLAAFDRLCRAANCDRAAAIEAILDAVIEGHAELTGVRVRYNERRKAPLIEIGKRLGAERRQGA